MKISETAGLERFENFVKFHGLYILVENFVFCMLTVGDVGVGCGLFACQQQLPPCRYVSELSFYRLVQFCTIALYHCDEVH